MDEWNALDTKINSVLFFFLDRLIAFYKFAVCIGILRRKEKVGDKISNRDRVMAGWFDIDAMMIIREYTYYDLLLTIQSAYVLHWEVYD